MSLAPLLVLSLVVAQDHEDLLPKPTPPFKHSVPFRTAAVSRDGSILIGLDVEGAIRGWDVRTGRRLYGRPVLAKGDGPQRLTCSPDGRYVALSSRAFQPSIVRVLRLDTGEEVRRFDRCFSPVFSPDGEILAGTDGESLRRWSMKSGAELPALEVQGQGLKWTAYSPKGDRLAASDSAGGRVTIWDVAGRKRVDGDARDDFAATALAFSPDGKVLAIGNPWSIRFLPSDRRFGIHEEYGNGPLRFSEDGRRMIALSSRRRLLIWELSTGRPLFTWSAFNISEGILEVSEGGDRVIWFDRDGLRVERIPEILGGPEEGHVVRAVSFTAEGQAVTADNAGQIRFWDPATQKEVRRLSVDGGEVNLFTVDGRWVVYGGGSRPVRVWDLPTGKEIANVTTSPYVGSVALSPDRTTLARGHADGSLSLWDVAEKKERVRIHQELGGVHAICWSPDGKTLAWVDKLGSVVMADGAAGRDPIRFKPRGDVPVRELRFEPGGKTLWVSDIRGVCWAYKDDLSREPVREELTEYKSPRDPDADRRWVASGFEQRRGSAAVFAPDRRYAISTTDWGAALIWEAPGEK